MSACFPYFLYRRQCVRILALGVTDPAAARNSFATKAAAVATTVAGKVAKDTMPWRSRQQQMFPRTAKHRGRPLRPNCGPVCMKRRPWVLGHAALGCCTHHSQASGGRPAGHVALSRDSYYNSCTQTRRPLAPSSSSSSRRSSLCGTPGGKRAARKGDRL